jgi:hypothetical protein
MDDFGNGVAVAVEALQDDFDLVDVLWCATLEVARLSGVVDAGMPRRTPWRATSSTRSSTAAMRSAGVSPGVHLVRQLLHQHLQLVKLGVAGCNVTR